MQGDGHLKKKLRGELLHKKPGVQWNDIVGLHEAKQVPSLKPPRFA